MFREPLCRAHVNAPAMRPQSMLRVGSPQPCRKAAALSDLSRCGHMRDIDPHAGHIYMMGTRVSPSMMASMEEWILHPRRTERPNFFEYVYMQ